MALTKEKAILATLPIISFLGKTYLQKKQFDTYQIGLHAVITAGVMYSSKDGKANSAKLKDITLEIFKFSIISSIAILTKDQPPLVKITAKVATELCARFSADRINGINQEFSKFTKDNILGVAAHHTLNEYRVFDSMFGEYAWLLKPATRCVDYSLNKAMSSEFEWEELVATYLGNAAYLNTAAPKILSENVIEKSMAISLTTLLKAFTKDAAKDIAASFS